MSLLGELFEAAMAFAGVLGVLAIILAAVFGVAFPVIFSIIGVGIPIEMFIRDEDFNVIPWRVALVIGATVGLFRNPRAVPAAQFAEPGADSAP